MQHGFTLGRAATANFCESRSVGFIDFPGEGVIYDIPDTVHAAHNADEQDLSKQRGSPVVGEI